MLQPYKSFGMVCAEKNAQTMPSLRALLRNERSGTDLKVKLMLA